MVRGIGLWSGREARLCGRQVASLSSSGREARLCGGRGGHPPHSGRQVASFGWRWLICAAVVLPFAAVMAEAQPPAPEGKVPEGKNGVNEMSTSAERAKLQSELLLLLKRLSAAPAPNPHPSPPPKSRPEVTEGSRVDAIREGMNLFRDNDFEAARRAFQLIDPTALGREDRAFVRYMLATSLRRLGRIAEAEAIYREVANSPDDEFLASCAIWQLSLIRSEQELQLQLEQLRARAKSK